MSLINSSDVSAGDDINAVDHNLLRDDIGYAAPTGIMNPYAGTTAPSGWVICTGLTLGNAASGASGRANADTESLFTLLWDSFADAQLAVSGGRGANAAADYAANKTIEIPDLQERMPVGYKNAGTFDPIGDTAGTETHTLLTAEMPAHTHTINVYNAGGTGFAYNGTSTTLTGTPATSSTGGGGAHNNLQPYFVSTYIIKL